MPKKKLDIESMYQKITDSFESASKKGGDGIYKNILRFEKGKDYIVRLLPNIHDLEKTVFNYSYRGWTSKATGKYVEFIDPPTDELNPIQAYSTTISNSLRGKNLHKDDPRMKFSRNLWARKAWLVNCYVISDPSNPDNEGEVRILKMGSQLWDIVHEHYKGDRADEFGIKIFDPTAKGCNFKIKAVDNGGGYPKYDKSYFMSPSDIDGLSDNQDKIQEVFDKTFDLATIFPVKTREELENAVNIHIKGGTNDSGGSEAPSFKDIDELIDDKSESDDDSLEEDVPYDDNGDSDNTDGDDIDDLIAKL
jgi:hypothetical protein